MEYQKNQKKSGSATGAMHDGHRDRLRARFRREGLDKFEVHNIMELLLFYGIPRRDTNETAHALIDRFGSLSGVLDAPYEELCKVPGVGESAATFLKLLPELCRVYMDDQARGVRIVNGTEDAARLLGSKFIGRRVEAIVLLLLDSKGKVLYCDVVREGSIHAVDVNMKEIISICSTYDAAGAIIAHNHPSGLALPSKGDLETTKKLCHAIQFIGVQLYDHMIFADGDFVSLHETAGLEYLFEEER